MLFLAWWVIQTSLDNRDVKNLMAIFRQSPENTDTVIEHITKELKGQRFNGCLTSGLVPVAPEIMRMQRAKPQKQREQRDSGQSMAP